RVDNPPRCAGCFSAEGRFRAIRSVLITSPSLILWESSAQVQIKTASRLSFLPPYLFAELDRLKREVQQKGVDVISLGVGDPDLPTPAHIVAACQRAAELSLNHRYPDYQGLDRFREAACGWYKR